MSRASRMRRRLARVGLEPQPRPSTTMRAARAVGLAAVLVLALALVLAGSGCAALREAFTEDRSTWSPAMRADVEACDAEVLDGRWGWGRARPDGFTVGFGEARLACLSSRGWPLEVRP